MPPQVSPSYFYAPVFFLLWVLVLWLTKRIVFRRLKQWAEGTSFWWDDIVVESLSFPINFLILASGMALFSNLLPLSDDAGRWAAVGLRGSVILCIVLFLDNLVRRAIDKHAMKSTRARASQGITKGLIRSFIIGIGALAFLDLLGISVTPILASLGIGSLAVALALQDTLSNFFAGLYVAMDKPVNVGDFVKLETGDEGYILDVGWRNTRIRALSNNIVIIPNTKLIGGVITNYSLIDKEVAVLVEVGVHYGSDLKKVERVTVEVGREILKKVHGKRFTNGIARKRS
ncbi:MAG: mechanosensitive ion channel family protein [Candidatus Omnitrophica bacterium]|nr:mechanosensitive ion channel family protein [Candidatus Omnitrophota bacterium]